MTAKQTFGPGSIRVEPVSIKKSTIVGILTALGVAPAGYGAKHLADGAMLKEQVKQTAEAQTDLQANQQTTTQVLSGLVVRVEAMNASQTKTAEDLTNLAKETREDLREVRRALRVPRQ